MVEKKWFIGFLIISLAFCVMFAGLMFFTDPLIQYGKENNLFTYYTYMEMYSNPGIAKNYDYNAVMVGTSMIENTDVQECNDLWNCQMVRLPYAGGTAKNMKTILDVCFDNNDDIKDVYWELDEYQLFGSSDETRHPLPLYLYRNDHLQDAHYLLNLDIFYHFDIFNLLGTLQGEVQKAAREGQSFDGVFSCESVLANYARPEKKNEQVDPLLYVDRISDNLNKNIAPLIEENPNTTFSFFFAPFSILYWDTEIRNGTFDAAVNGVIYAVDKLLEYTNVQIYFYHNCWDIVTDLDNYKDLSHYGKWINSYITKAMACNEGRLIRDNFRNIIEEMRAYVKKYDFEKYF